MSSDDTPTPDSATDSRARLLSGLRRTVNVLLVLALVAVVVPFVIYGAPGVVGADEAFVVLSGSMMPVMQPGDVVIVNDVDTATIQEGDVITFVRQGSDTPTTHRVIDVRELERGTAFQTKGDANEDPDARLVYPEQVVGQVGTVEGRLFVIPLIGYVIQYGKTPIGFAALVATPIVLLVASELFVLVRNARRGGRESDTDGETPTDDGETGAVTGAAATEALPDEESVGDDENNGDSNDGGHGSTISVSGRDLRVTTVVLAVFGPYSAWVAYRDPNVVSITVGVAGIVLFVLALAIVLATRGGNDDAPTAASGQGGDATVTDGGVEAVSGQYDFPAATDAPALATLTPPDDGDDDGGDGDE